ncbi:alpha/beta fold hydrolase [Gordonia soli]|uniref:Putative hydrolase n=1 Tax=Gordonia soli NBRC 108243 TaxID=1223545 RepID=M0QH14_9ACTN|nr:alpha/beta hydrolase [Gordonia soli]GAC67729.1 putative hydrolase [Gordonia soli NBRC 108243]
MPEQDLTAGLGAQTVVDLPAGPVRVYRRGAGPTIVFVHGMSVNAAAWRRVVPALADEFDCVTADWPFGAHQMPMSPDADLSAPGIADIIASTIERLGLSDVTLVGNDGGGLLTQVMVTRHPHRIGRVVLTNCDAYENFPPPEFDYLCRVARLPVSPRLASAALRPAFVGRLFGRWCRGFGGLHRHPVPDAVIDHHLRGLRESPEVFRDFVKFLRSVDAEHAITAARGFGDVHQPVLVAWAPGDRFFPEHHAHRLAADFPDARLEFIDDSNTWVAEDNPDRVIELIRGFVDGGRSPSVSR